MLVVPVSCETPPRSCCEALFLLFTIYYLTLPIYSSSNSSRYTKCTADWNMYVTHTERERRARAGGGVVRFRAQTNVGAPQHRGGGRQHPESSMYPLHFFCTNSFFFSAVFVFCLTLCVARHQLFAAGVGHPLCYAIPPMNATVFTQHTDPPVNRI